MIQQYDVACTGHIIYINDPPTWCNVHQSYQCHLSQSFNNMVQFTRVISFISVIQQYGTMCTNHIIFIHLSDPITWCSVHHSYHFHLSQWSNNMVQCASVIVFILVIQQHEIVCTGDIIYHSVIQQHVEVCIKSYHLSQLSNNPTTWWSVHQSYNLSQWSNKNKTINWIFEMIYAMFEMNECSQQLSRNIKV